MAIVMSIRPWQFLSWSSLTIVPLAPSCVQSLCLLPVVLFAVTGYDWKNAQIRSKEYGFEEHLLKPVDPERLRSLLDALKQRLATQGGGQ